MFFLQSISVDVAWHWFEIFDGCGTKVGCNTAMFEVISTNISPLCNVPRLHKILHDDICVVVLLLHSVFSCFLIATAGWIAWIKLRLVGISAFLLVKGLQSRATTESFSWAATLRPWRRCCKTRTRGNVPEMFEMKCQTDFTRVSQKDWVAGPFKVVHAF